ncbi:MAG: RNA methyltransferase [Pseudonocardiaceae bacterium]|nr:RNA methyltransferase [Pseudonocardiaceae bacterium]
MTDQRPGVAPFTERTPRVVAARRLTTRSGRDEAGRFLVEGAQAVREALDWAALAPGRMPELFVTEAARARHPELVDRAELAGARISVVTERAAAACSETVTPQGVIAVCTQLTQPLEAALTGAARLVAVLVGVADPGNAGTVLRVADAAGADAVVFAGEAVDPHNGKCVRSSTGSIFHLPVVRGRDTPAVLRACRATGLWVLAADGRARTALDEAGDQLGAPAAWLFGSEAHGLPETTLGEADVTIKVPIYGAAESLNLGTAAAVCLYASAMAQRTRNRGLMVDPTSDHLGSTSVPHGTPE